MKTGPRRHLLAGAAAALAAGASVVLFLQSRTFDQSDYFEDSAVLQRVKQLNAQLELDVLRSRTGLASHYDQVVSDMDEMRRLVDEMSADAATERYEQAAQLEKTRAALRDAVHAKASLIERFKSSNSILRNSTAFLPTAADDVAGQSRGGGAGELARRVMLAVLVGGPGADTAELEVGLHQLQASTARLGAAAKERVEIFVAHVRTIMREREIVAGLLTDLMALPVGRHTDELARMLDTDEQRAHAHTMALRSYLILLSGALATLLLYAGLRLLRSHREVARVNNQLQDANEHLEQRVAQRGAELRKTQDELVATARQAGMAEIATAVLHNVGNILNTVNVSAGLVAGMARNSRGQGLDKAVQMMKEHEQDLPAFIAADPRGRLLPGYLEGLAQAMGQERQGMARELDHLVRSVDHIKAVVATQQSYARRSHVRMAVHMRELVEDALRINGDAQPNPRVEVVRDYGEVPQALLDRDRVLQILVNLISNAKHAMKDPGARSQRLTLQLGADAGRLRVCVRDEGEGIAPENLAKVFSHGFTTRKSGHGFGLHSCALAATQMGGTLTAHSDGPGRGATFTLELPLAQEEVAA